MGTVFKRPDSDNWYISYSIAGRLFKEAAAKTKAHATALLAKRETDIFEGTHFPDKRRKGLTLAALRELWLEHASGKRSLADDRTRFGTIVDHFGASAQVATLSPADEHGDDQLDRRGLWN